MKTDKLTEELKKVEIYCKENKIKIIYGRLGNNNFTSIIWANKPNIEEYFELIKLTENKILILNIVENKFDINKTIQFQNDFYEKEEIEKFNKNLKVLQNSCKIVKLSMYFIYENLIIDYSNETEYYKEYDEVMFLIERYEKWLENNEIINEKEKNNEKINEIIYKIKINDEYVNAKTEYDKKEVVDKLLSKEFIDDDIINIIKNKMAEYYLNVIKVEEDNQLISEIKKLQDLKMTKKDMASKLDISMTTLNKFYYLAKDE